MIAVRTLTDGGQTSPQIAQSIADYLASLEPSPYDGAPWTARMQPISSAAAYRYGINL